MAAAAGRVDELVKDYLLFRGCTASLRNFEYELKTDKDKGLRADKILEQFQQYIGSYNLHSLRDFWAHLNSRLFCRLEQRYIQSVRKLEVGLLKLYVVNAAHNNRADKVTDFFEKMTNDLHQVPEFKEWFCFPFIKSPEENSHFSMYFTKQWQDMFYLSLFNFLSVIINVMPAPILLNFDIEHKRMKNLQEENDMLKTQLLSADKAPVLKTPNIREKESIRRGANSVELHYDFSDLGDDTLEIQKQQKSGRKFPFSASPLLNRKPNFLSSNNKSPTKSQGKAKAGKPQSVNIQKKHPSSGSPSNQGHPEFTNRSLSSGGAVQKAGHPETTSRSFSLQGKSTAIETSRQKSVPNQGKQSSGTRVDDLYTTVTAENVPGPKQENPVQDKTKKNQGDSSGEVTVNTKSSYVNSETIEDLTPVNDNNNFTGITRNQSVIDKSDYLQEGQGPFLLLSQEDYKEHHSAISYARFSNMGQYVGSVDIDGIVKIWSWSPQPTTCATVMSKSAFLSLDWASKQDRWLLLGNRSGNIRLFDVKEMKSFYEASADSSYPRIVSLSSSPSSGAFICSATVNRARSGSGSDIGPSSSIARVGKLTLWELRTMKQTKHLEIQPGPVAINCCSFNHNGHLLLTGGVDGAIRLFDMQQHKVISQWEAHSGEVQNLQFSSDETSCYSIGTDGKLIQWSMHKPGTLNDLPIHSGASLPFLSGMSGGLKEMPRGQIFSLDAEGEYMLTCDKTKGSMYQVKDKSLSHVMDIQGHGSFLTTVDWSPNMDTKVCLTGSMDGTIKISTLLSTHM
ncbi:WD repeat-containing protein 91-like [Saccostrea echinata]|uniref:WD repeat-containing protein 91-like n=1 Tax=Saccostrea echinata TaxID=191078 RepID=UPI002A81092A|nr:WD repeat-containing protein 91-like [Saccostrea echinata]